MTYPLSVSLSPHQHIAAIMSASVPSIRVSSYRISIISATVYASILGSTAYSSTLLLLGTSGPSPHMSYFWYLNHYIDLSTDLQQLCLSLTAPLMSSASPVFLLHQSDVRCSFLWVIATRICYVMGILFYLMAMCWTYGLHQHQSWVLKNNCQSSTVFCVT